MFACSDGLSSSGTCVDTALAVQAISDGGPIERWERLMERAAQNEADVVDEVVARVVEGDSLGMIARDWGLPRARFIAWMSGDEGRRGAYEGALRMRADELVHESLRMATTNPAGHAVKVAGLWDRARFGDGDGASGMKVVVVRFSEGVSPEQSAALEHNSDG